MGFKIGRVNSGSSDLPRCVCGNNTHWQSIEFGDKEIRAVCVCGKTVTAPR